MAGGGASESNRLSINCFSLRMTSSGLETEVGEEGPPLEQAEDDDTLYPEETAGHTVSIVL